MLVDRQLMFEAGAKTLGSVATHSLTNVIDFGHAAPNLGMGMPLWAVMIITVSMLAGVESSSTYQGIIQESSNGTAWSTLFATSINYISSADVVSMHPAGGTVFMNQPIPATHKRYLRAVFCISEDAMSSLDAGRIKAFLSKSAMYTAK